MQSRGWRADDVGGATRLVASTCVLEAPAADEVLIEVHAAVLDVPELSPSRDRLVGGACVGRVIDTGEAAAALLGTRVAVGPVMACGECDTCRRGAVAVCPHGEVLGVHRHGALASHVVAKARWLCELIEPLELPTPAAALLGREATTAYAMFVRTGIGPGEPVVIIGDNTAARLLIDIAVAKGVRPMVISSADTAWQDAVATRGGEAVPWQDDADALRDRVGEVARAGGHSKRPWRVLCTSHLQHHRVTALALAGAGSSVTLAGPPAVAAHGPVTVDLERALGHDVTVVCVAAGHPDLMPEVAALAVRGQLDLDCAARVIGPDDVSDTVTSLLEETRAAAVGETHAVTTTAVVVM